MRKILNYTKIALGIEYNGSRYKGWQKQNNFKNTVQETIESVLSFIAQHEIKLYSAGRTDSGVHSIGQVAHFYTSTIKTMELWISSSNSFLPDDITILWARSVPFYFHARHSALSRHYRYIIYNKKYKTAIFKNFLCHVNKKLDIKNMQFAGNFLLGEHDFSSFRSKGCQSSSNYRKLTYFNILRDGPLIIIDIIANAFLYHMVRNIVGCLIDIGTCKKNVFYIKDLLKMNNRMYASSTANSNGLYLIHVKYPKFFNIPKSFKSFI
ncbi:tRNA pseudouridine(38-40) synthase TruA [Buchnera aphidicola (Mollitrichosiphum nigrofasciatum)]|uniref:tRNA pseudouridine(38-40) synthase TruA n=1 Tax=Buchnera aphidicola TaxID=9 RepID=UPI0031B8585E